jgi:DNA-binding NtrC family response regulator
VQDRQVRRVGSNKYIPVDVRILAASNKDLRALVSTREFREDLFYRLSVVTIHMPSLEERTGDIPLLVRHFLEKSNQKSRRNIRISDAAIALLQSAAWPGNVRELENFVERLAIFCTSGEIEAEDVQREKEKETHQPVSSAPPGTLEEMERQHITRILRESAGNKARAARFLGVERKTLYQKARRLGIDLHTKKP